MCTKFEPFLDDHAQGLFDPQMSEAIEDHLESCQSCLSATRSIKSFRTLSSQAGLHRPNPYLPYQIMRRIKENREKPMGWRWFSAGFSTAVAVAVLLVFVVPQKKIPVPELAGGAVPVTFSVQFPAAQDVSLVGDFNGWNPDATKLVRKGNAWTCTIELKQGQYQYMFVIDGEKWETDPKAVQQVEDGYGRKNALLTL